MSKKKYYDEHGNEIRSRPEKANYKKVSFWLIIILSIIVGAVGMFILTNNGEIADETKNENMNLAEDTETNEKEKAEEKENKEQEYSEESEIKETEEKNEELNDTTSDFDNLSQAIQIHLAASIVDERAKEHDLKGYTLNYNLIEDILFVQVHSGAGVGHPIYKLQIDSDSITPLEGIVRVSVEEIEQATVDTRSINKTELYNHYLEHKNVYKDGQGNMMQADYLTKEDYEETKNRIK
ncbi:MAG TPA: hypothetical protein VK121_11775 [Pseudogracilibacillus sp.]|nr:hypothetical protein [Pseudogracilibacillus sp.]